MVRLVRRLERSDRVNLSWIANRKGKRSDCGEGKQWIGNLLVLTCGCGSRSMIRNDARRLSTIRFRFTTLQLRRGGAARSRSTGIVDRETLSRWPFAIPSRGILVGSSWDPRGFVESNHVELEQILLSIARHR